MNTNKLINKKYLFITVYYVLCNAGSMCGGGGEVGMWVS